MQSKKKLALLLIFISFILAVYSYPRMPLRMASHWNAGGQADGYMGRLYGVFLMPVLSLAMLLLFILLPKIDPLRSNYRRFQNDYDSFILLLIGYLLYIYLLTLIWNLGYQYDMARMMAPGFGFLIYCIGVLIENAKRNWFFGIRTPWTMSDDGVWDRTHKVGGKAFRIAGVIAFVTMILRIHMAIALIPLFIAILYPILYSYIDYRRHVKVL